MDLTFLNQFTLKSEFTEDKVVELGKEVNTILFEKYKGLKK